MKKRNIFDTIKGQQQKRTAFNLSHDKKLSMKMGELVPILCEEVVPGDSWDVKTQSFIRLAPMIAPVMHKVDTYIHYFYVPNRIIWDGWQDFITGESAAAPPTLGAHFGILQGELSDYLGLPMELTGSKVEAAKIMTLPHRAYNSIFNEYYRDQNLVAEVDITDPLENQYLRKRAWEKDYFTSALPWTQKGGEGLISMSLEPRYMDESFVRKADGTPAAGDMYSAAGVYMVNNPSSPTPGRLENLDTMDGTISVNDFRIAHRIQKWFERQARAGSRYTETILSHFGIHTGDARLNRPEYLGGGKQPVVISEVLNTNGNEGGVQDVPQGHMSGHGISVGQTAKANKRFSEHGYIMGIMSVIPKTAYQEGIPKSFLRQDKFDYYWPEFAHLGEQEVMNKELWFSGSPVIDDGTFGYQSRYAEYKYKSSSVHGDMRKELLFYHMGRKFAALPALNESFITCDTADINSRVFAAADAADQLWVQIHHSIIARRPMPYYGTPTI